MQINERWLQFGYINTKGNVTKAPFRIPFDRDLEIDTEYDVDLLGKQVTFTCVREETISNNNDTVDKVYVIATNNQ